MLIKKHLTGTPLEGNDAVFMNCTVDPLLLLSIGLAESNLARSYGEAYNETHHNPFGLSSNGYVMELSSWEQSIDMECKTVTRMIGKGATTISMLGAVYAEDPYWEGKVQSFYDKLLKELEEM
jgi:hypothetical protein